ncbi:DsbA family protein [Streptomyces sp. NPDC007901]|uniref:DsbA family protein n=1 Tax=Streptomyces sp. NPDC007901 TaxID=3364785 RepID=UPI0036E648C8
MRTLRIDVWSDVVCPWCHIGKRRLETALGRFEHADEVEVHWHSFQLEPRPPPGATGGPSWTRSPTRPGRRPPSCGP